mgnify:FL=1
MCDMSYEIDGSCVSVIDVVMYDSCCRVVEELHLLFYFSLYVCPLSFLVSNSGCHVSSDLVADTIHRALLWRKGGAAICKGVRKIPRERETLGERRRRVTMGMP